ncbi:jg13639 [Pararge aegeria aegeria]|uniref:Jg13639 protein n=1 Tax=Pararge aegeria aegeria TaxID=348720 RepID=A0A8S4S9X0_9NEOP|nr:jg13639 [Pararge aegeria aegeria]
MPVKYACLSCQGPLAGPCGPNATRVGGCGVGPCCVHAIGANCKAPCGEAGCIHGLDIPSTRWTNDIKRERAEELPGHTSAAGTDALAAVSEESAGTAVVLRAVESYDVFVKF